MNDTTAASAHARDKSRTIKNIIDNHGVKLDWQKAFYQDMHANPELSGFEVETARKIAAHLRNFDCEVHTGIGGHGIVAIFRNGDGPTALFRADFDALPVKETSGAIYASTRTRVRESGVETPIMHACGHDMHTTALLGACAVMDSTRDSWSGTFVALFQPAEEISVGAAAMVNDGLADIIPKPDVCFGQHVIAGPAGRILSRPGAALAACDTITIKLYGKSAHGSMPHNSIDPTYLAAMIVVRLQGIVGREINPNDFAVITVGSLISGHTNNTVPGEATLVLNCRFYDNEVKRKTYQAIKRVVHGECQASGCERAPEFRFSNHGELTENDPVVYSHVRYTFDEVFGEESVDAKRWTASEDFTNIPRAFGAPYFFWLVGITPREQWDKALAEDNIEDIPVNHAGDFLPDYEPSVDASTKAALCAVLTYLVDDKSEATIQRPDEANLPKNLPSDPTEVRSEAVVESANLPDAEAAHRAHELRK
ncbi:MULTISPECIES: amidohydrolase [unclassified Corynebacterium]|uniref:amidohydrolase n=1 Tax=Corynebacterium TaxID=1716 RepID=UPI00124E0452